MASPVASIVKEAIETEGFEVVKLRSLPNKQIKVWVDKEPDGVNVQDCVDLNRIVRHHMEDCGLDPGEYALEVQSPGVDRLLARPKDFLRFQGERVKVRLYEKRPELARKNFRGTLVGFADDELVIEGDDTWTFTRDEIDEVRLDPALPEPSDKERKRGRKRKPTKSRRKRPKEH